MATNWSKHQVAADPWVKSEKDVLDHLWIYGHIGLLRKEESAFPTTSLEIQGNV